MKIEGKDVVGTWKVMISFVLIPVLHVTYFVIVRFMAGTSWSVLFFFGMPMLFVPAIQGVEKALKLARSIRPLVMLLFYRDAAWELDALRTRCKTDVRTVVEELDWGHKLDASRYRRSTVDDEELNSLALELGMAHSADGAAAEC